MRSCARLILEAATISIALVIFRVFCTLRIFIRISLVPGILSSCRHPRGSGGPGSSKPLDSRLRGNDGLKTPAPFPVLDRRLERLLLVGGQVVLVLHALH